MADPTSIPAPNYTQIPNIVLELMADMTDAEFRVVMAIARQTFGWHKKRDKISLSQLAKLTGMSRQGVVNGLDAGIKRGLIERSPDPEDRRGGIWYRLLVNDVDQSSMLTSQYDDQSTALTRTSQRGRPDLVNVVDTQKKDKERKESVCVSDLARALADLCKINPTIASRRQKDGLNTAYQGLRQLDGTPDQVVTFTRWWYSDSNWRTRKANEAGRKPEPPRPDQVLEEWEAAIKPTPVNANRNHHSSEVLPPTKPNIAPDAISMAERARRAKEAGR